ncbi:MAG: GNAT family N-acetyltransferase [Alphaproteobacteria bacterium]|nr:GNAT family N-acetyltransferase [Alphaproteobacteria bacterium]
MTFCIKVFKGADILPYLQTLADMRLKAFCDFPYLYVGNMEEELVNLKEYAATPQGLLVLAFKEDCIAGVYSGMPLTTPGSFLEYWTKKLIRQGIEVKDTFYAGDLIIEPAFQKQKCCSLLIKQLIHEVEAMGFSKIIGITAIRSLKHPLRPPHFRDSDSLWPKLGAKKLPMSLSAIWDTRQADGSIKKEKNLLACWIIHLNLPSLSLKP